MFILYGREHVLLGLPYFLSSLPRLVCLLGISSCQTNLLDFCFSYFLFPWASIIHWLAHYSLFFPPLIVFMDLLAYWVLLLPLDSYSSFTLPLMRFWAYWLSFPTILAHWAFTSFLGLSWPTCFTFTSYCAHGLASCHFLPCWPNGLLPLSLSFHGSLYFYLLLCL